jgi:hypothetical protein
MKNLGTLLAGVALTVSFVVMQGCSFSTANMSGLTTSTDKEGKTAATSFKSGDTLYAKAPIANNPGKVKVKFALVAEDVKGLTKGETLKGSEVSVDVEGDNSANFNVTVAPGFPGGTYKLNADMLNDKGEKKDGKSVSITVANSAPAPAAPKADDKEDAEDADEK